MNIKRLTYYPTKIAALRRAVKLGYRLDPSGEFVPHVLVHIDGFLANVVIGPMEIVETAEGRFRANLDADTWYTAYRATPRGAISAVFTQMFDAADRAQRARSNAVGELHRLSRLWEGKEP